MFRNIHGLTEEKRLGEEKRSRRDEFIPFPRTYLIYPPKLSTQYMTYRGNMRKEVFCLLKRNETGRVGGTDTRSTVLDGLTVGLLEIRQK